MIIILVIYKTDKKKLRNILNKIKKNYPIVIIDNSKNYDFKNLIFQKKLELIYNHLKILGLERPWI